MYRSEPVTWCSVDPSIQVWLDLGYVWPSRHQFTGRLPLYIQDSAVVVDEPVIARLYRAAVTCRGARIAWVREVAVRTAGYQEATVWGDQHLIVPLEAIQPHPSDVDRARAYDDLFTSWQVEPLPARRSVMRTHLSRDDDESREY